MPGFKFGTRSGAKVPISGIEKPGSYFKTTCHYIFLSAPGFKTVSKIADRIDKG